MFARLIKPALEGYKLTPHMLDHQLPQCAVNRNQQFRIAHQRRVSDLYAVGETALEGYKLTPLMLDHQLPQRAINRNQQFRVAHQRRVSDFNAVGDLAHVLDKAEEVCQTCRTLRETRQW